MNIKFKQGQKSKSRFTLQHASTGQAVLVGINWFLMLGVDHWPENSGDNYYFNLLNLETHNVTAHPENTSVDDIRDVLEIVIEGVEPKQEIPF